MESRYITYVPVARVELMKLKELGNTAPKVRVFGYSFAWVSCLQAELTPCCIYRKQHYRREIII
jgi:hypothetical protein